MTSELVPVWFQSNSLGAVDAIDSCLIAWYIRECWSGHHLAGFALEETSIVGMSAAFDWRNRMTDTSIGSKISKGECLSGDSASNIVSWRTIVVLEEVVVDLVEFIDDIWAGIPSVFSCLFGSAFYSWWVSSEAGGARTFESTLIVCADT